MSSNEKMRQRQAEPLESLNIDSEACFAGLRVLVAEDNEVNKMVAEFQLTSLGCTVKGATHGQETLDNFLAEPFDLILMDCQMPVMDGFEATSQIRMLQAGTGNRIPIVAMTAFTTEFDRKACLAAGMDDFIAKPISKKIVVQVLGRTLARLKGWHVAPYSPVTP